jgi:FAD/FMN-containing dehydrogenase
VIFAADPDRASAESLREWVVSSWEALHPFSAGGSYVNFLVDEGQERVEASYRDNYARLREIKKRYDPTNLFQLNQNIRPAD